MCMVCGCILTPFLRIRAFFRFLIPVFEWMSEWMDGWMSVPSSCRCWHLHLLVLLHVTTRRGICGQEHPSWKSWIRMTERWGRIRVMSFKLLDLTFFFFKWWGERIGERIFPNKWCYFWWFLYSFTWEGRSRLDQVVGSLRLSPHLNVPRQWALC